MNEPKSTKFKSLIMQAAKLAADLREKNPDDDYTELSKKLDKHFPGLLEMSKELGNDKQFLSDAGVQSDMLSAHRLSKTQDEYKENLRKVTNLTNSSVGILHTLALKFSLVLGLELGYIVAKLYDQQSSKDDEFDKFMRSLGMEPPGGTVQ